LKFASSMANEIKKYSDHKKNTYNSLVTKYREVEQNVGREIVTKEINCLNTNCRKEESKKL
jgi:hypothetical protein